MLAELLGKSLHNRMRRIKCTDGYNNWMVMTAFLMVKCPRGWTLMIFDHVSSSWEMLKSGGWQVMRYFQIIILSSIWPSITSTPRNKCQFLPQGILQCYWQIATKFIKHVHVSTFASDLYIALSLGHNFHFHKEYEHNSIKIHWVYTLHIICFLFCLYILME